MRLHLYKKLSIANIISNLYIPPVAPITFDPYWNNVVLAMHMDGTNGSISFIDEKGHVISSNGVVVNTTINKFNSSAYFNANGFLSTTFSNNELAIGTGDFTAEMWVKMNTTNVNQRIIGSSNYAFDININTQVNAFTIYLGNGSYGGLDTVFPNNGLWHHIAVTRANSSLKIFVDGVQTGNTMTSTDNIAATAFMIGSDYMGNSKWSGYIDDLRITKGVARYTTNFIVPTTPFSDTNSIDYYWDNTALLMHFDNSYTNVTGYGSAVVGGSPTFSTDSKFGTHAVNFAGNSAVMYTNPKTIVLNEDFTLEFCVKFNSIQTGSTFHIVDLLNGTTSGGNSCYFYTYNRYGVQSFELNYAGQIWNYNVALSTSKYYYITISRKAASSQVLIFINGELQSTLPLSATSGILNTVHIGGFYQSNGTVLYSSDVKIDELRLTKGVARYTSNFSVPTKALPDAPTNDPYWQQTAALLHMDGDLIDQKGHQTINENGVGFTTIKKYGTHSGQFINNHYASIESSVDFNLGSTDFTIEAWIYPTITAPTVAQAIVGRWWAGGGGAGINHSWMIQRNTSAGYLQFTAQSGTTQYAAITAVSPAVNAWTHVAVVRSGTSLKIYLNGVLNVTTTLPNFDDKAIPVIIGAFLDQTGGNISQGFDGYIDDLRITKGVARYLGNFTPSTQAFLN